MELEFIRRVYKTSTAVCVFILIWCGALHQWQVAAGTLIGYVISIGSLLILERYIRLKFVAERTEEKDRTAKRTLIIAILKYAVIAVIFWISFKTAWISPIGLMIGIGIPYAVIFLKALGRSVSFDVGLNRRE